MIAMNTETNTNTAAPAAPHRATVAPGKAPAKKAASRKKNAPKAPKKATGAKSARPVKAGKKPTTTPTPPNATSKGGMILEMIGRAKGATRPEIMAATGWQAHSVRAFISIAPKKHAVKIESSKNDAGERVYRSNK
jgi:hypothetical protein